jgi:hypothetical protein
MFKPKAAAMSAAKCLVSAPPGAMVPGPGDGLGIQSYPLGDEVGAAEVVVIARAVVVVAGAEVVVVVVVVVVVAVVVVVVG